MSNLLFSATPDQPSTPRVGPASPKVTFLDVRSPPPRENMKSLSAEDISLLQQASKVMQPPSPSISGTRTVAEDSVIGPEKPEAMSTSVKPAEDPKPPLVKPVEEPKDPPEDKKMVDEKPKEALTSIVSALSPPISASSPPVSALSPLVTAVSPSTSVWSSDAVLMTESEDSESPTPKKTTIIQDLIPGGEVVLPRAQSPTHASVKSSTVDGDVSELNLSPAASTSPSLPPLPPPSPPSPVPYDLDDILGEMTETGRSEEDELPSIYAIDYAQRPNPADDTSRDTTSATNPTDKEKHTPRPPIKSSQTKLNVEIPSAELVSSLPADFMSRSHSPPAVDDSPSIHSQPSTATLREAISRIFEEGPRAPQSPEFDMKALRELLHKAIETTSDMDMLGLLHIEPENVPALLEGLQNRLEAIEQEEAYSEGEDGSESSTIAYYGETDEPPKKVSVLDDPDEKEVLRKTIKALKRTRTNEVLNKF